MVNSSPARSQIAALEARRTLIEALSDRPQPLHVELHAGALHLHQHVHQRQLDLVQEPGEPVLLEALARWRSARSAGEHGALGRSVGARHVHAETGVRGQLVQGIAPPRRVDQVAATIVSCSSGGATDGSSAMASAFQSWATTGRSPRAA